MKRRDFLKNTALTTAAMGFPTIVPASVFGKNAPSNRITVGFIGTGRQVFGANLPQMMAVEGVQVVSVCDVDAWRRAEAQKVVNDFYAKQKGVTNYKGCQSVGDYRDVINDKEIDALMISTPDHWHIPMGLMAAKAKKHFTIEKPLSLSVQQGRQLADAVKKYGVIARTDSEFRSVRKQNFAVELVRNGHLGDLQRVEITFPSDPTPVPTQADMAVPSGLNYDMWLGPAPFVPYTQMRVHDLNQTNKRPNWMRIDTYAQGMIANWGAHYFDMAQWANNSEYSGPVEVEGKGEFPKSLWNTMINFKVAYKYANGVEMTCEQSPTSKPSIKYIGSKEWVRIDGYPGEATSSNPALLDLKPKSGELDLTNILWDKNDFIQGVRQNKQTLEPIEVGHRSITISQIGLIACQIGEKLKWQPEKELFEGNNAANALLAAPLLRDKWL
jgi:myo-inositol 2-dehydrogenase / D-chiro-inositol 1-dehydrogenase